jgi:hypothetical protein
MDVCYNSVEIFLSLVSFFLLQLQAANTVAPTATPEVAKFKRASALDLNLILSDFSDMGESTRFIEF